MVGCLVISDCFQGDTVDLLYGATRELSRGKYHERFLCGTCREKEWQKDCKSMSGKKDTRYANEHERQNVIHASILGRSASQHRLPARSYDR